MEGGREQGSLRKDSGVDRDSDEGMQVVRKIEATPIGDVFAPSEEYGDDTPWPGVEEYDDPDGDEEREKPLPYTPFDPFAELRRIRVLTSEERALSASEKRSIRAAQLENYRRDLLHQKEGIARMVTTLRHAVEATPAASAESLFALVNTFAPEYRLTHSQLYFFRSAIEAYQKKHTAVKTYRARYPDDRDFFAACFGKRPKGRVEVLQGPMTLYFRCFAEEDYVTIYTSPKTDSGKKDIDEDDIEQATDSSGVAKSTTLIEELDGTITAENVVKNDSHFVFVRGANRVEEMHGDKTALYLDEQRGDIDIEIKGVGTWRVEIVERDAEGNPHRLRLVNLHDATMQPLFDVTRLASTEEMRARNITPGVLQETRQPDARPMFNIIQYLRAPDGRVQGSIDMNYAFLTVEDSSPDGAVVHSNADDLVVMPNEEASERTRVHEEQHQFNKLFLPAEARIDRVMTVTQHAVESAISPEAAVEKCIHGLVRLERKWIGIDTRVRDELLAYYHEGRSTESIYRTMTESRLYDYMHKFQESIATIPQSVQARLQAAVSEVFYEERKDGSRMPIDARALRVDAAAVDPHIEEVFKEEYTTDLQRWLHAMTVLEQKGYAKDEIVSLLTQEPVNSWPNLARRVKAKTGE